MNIAVSFSKLKSLALSLRHHLPENLDEARVEMKRQLSALKSANILPADRRVSKGGYILRKLS